MDQHEVVAKNLLMNLPISLTMSIVAQWMNIALGKLQNFSLRDAAVNFVVSYLLAFLVGMTVPCEAWGAAFARRCGAQPGTLAFGLLLNLPVNTTFCVIMTLFMTWFNACLLNAAPLRVVPGGFAQMILPVWLACYAVSSAAAGPARRLARRCRQAPRRQKNV